MGRRGSLELKLHFFTYFICPDLNLIAPRKEVLPRVGAMGTIHVECATVYPPSLALTVLVVVVMPVRTLTLQNLVSLLNQHRKCVRSNLAHFTTYTHSVTGSDLTCRAANTTTVCSAAGDCECGQCRCQGESTCYTHVTHMLHG